MESARRGNRAVALARRVVQVADELAARAQDYARAPGWPARVQRWLAEFYDLISDGKAAAEARRESRRLWNAVAARGDLPEDLLAEARREAAN